MVERIKVVDIELEDLPASFEDLEHYSALRGLVRLHGVPIGYVDVPLSAGRCTALQLREVMLKQLEWPLLRQHLLHYLAADTQVDADLITQILTAPAPDYTGPIPLVTVAVCTRDRPDDLKLCLDALRQLDYPHLDIVIVDNAPATQATANLVRTYYPEMRYVREPRPGLNWARNRAILAARGEIVAYTDDDVIVDAGWVRALARVFATNPGVMAVTGLVVPYELETESQIAFERYGGFGRGFEQNGMVSMMRVANMRLPGTPGQANLAPVRIWPIVVACLTRSDFLIPRWMWVPSPMAGAIWRCFFAY